MYKRSILILLSYFYACHPIQTKYKMQITAPCTKKLLRNTKLFFNIIEQLASCYASLNLNHIHNFASDIRSRNIVMEGRPRTLNNPLYK